MKNTSNLPNNAMLPDDFTAALLLAVNPAMPESTRADALRSKVLAQIKTPAGRGPLSKTVPGDAQEWIPITPLVDLKILHEDGRFRSILMRLQAGARLPPHDHAGDEECLVLEGEGYIGDIHLRTGDYHLARKGMQHGETYTATGALVFMRIATAEAAGA